MGFLFGAPCSDIAKEPALSNEATSEVCIKATESPHTEPVQEHQSIATKITMAAEKQIISTVDTNMITSEHGVQEHEGVSFIFFLIIIF